MENRKECQAGQNKQGRDALLEQNPRVEARNMLIAAARNRPYTYIPPRLQLVLRENLPDE